MANFSNRFPDADRFAGPAGSPAITPLLINPFLVNPADAETRGFKWISFIASGVNTSATEINATFEQWTGSEWIPVFVEDIDGGTGLAPQVEYKPTLAIGAGAYEFIAKVPADLGVSVRCTFDTDVSMGAGSSIGTFYRRD